jgi:hypothetical protein
MLKNVWRTWFLTAFISAVAIILAAADSHADFPVDTWNVTVSGRTTGVGYLTFFDDPTWGKIVHGYIVIQPAFLNPANNPPEFHVGFFEVEGNWTFDASGKVTGFFSGGSQDVPLDVSFTATGLDSKKISIKGTGTDGVMNFKGVPSDSPTVPTTDLTGDWSAQVTKNGEKVTELFTIQPPSFQMCVYRDIDPDPGIVDIECVIPVPMPNLFELFGIHPFAGGPGYDLIGFVVLSAGKKIGVGMEELHIDKDTGKVDQLGDGVGRGVIGKINTTTFRATMKGTDDTSVTSKPSVFMTMTLP